MIFLTDFTKLSPFLNYFRPYWRCYFPNTQAIIYVVDSSDTERLVIAKEEFHAILEEEELKGAVVLIFANKQDLPGALDDAAVTESLELHKIKNRQWSIFKTSAIKGEGLFEGLDWYALYFSLIIHTHIGDRYNTLGKTHGPINTLLTSGIM
ncbi:putative small GTPase superfamily, ARF/SAR type, P-loop containing nucleoside triphosphate hydrolase [Helianthus annuus]|nr:putative small GTPase superfamily, ARF/SAR type, P-loop containing nucleoside triphosphate hydrolase [Helianthus annuus]